MNNPDHAGQANQERENVECAKKVAIFLGRLMGNEAHSLECLYEVAKYPELREIIGIKEQPNHRVRFDIISPIDYKPLQPPSDLPVLDWNYIYKMPLRNVFLVSGLYGGKLFASVDGRLARITEFISFANIAAEICEHPEENGSNPEDAARALKINVDSIATTLVLISKDNQYVVAVTNKPSKFKSKKIEELSGKKKLKLGPPAFIEGTGLQTDEVPPFSAFFNDAPVYIEASLLSKDFIYCSGGSKFTHLKIAPSEFVRFGAIPAKLT